MIRWWDDNGGRLAFRCCAALSFSRKKVWFFCAARSSWYLYERWYRSCMKTSSRYRNTAAFLWNINFLRVCFSIPPTTQCHVDDSHRFTVFFLPLHCWITYKKEWMPQWNETRTNWNFSLHVRMLCSERNKTWILRKNKRWIGWWQWQNSEKRANLLFTKDTNESIISLLLLLPLSSRCHTSLSYTLIHHLKDSRHIAYFSISPFQDSVKCVGNSNLSFFFSLALDYYWKTKGADEGCGGAP